MNSKLDRIKELTIKLKSASRAYYQENKEIMSNYEYDKLYDELEALEKETGIVLSGSPTITVGHEVLSELPKEAHESPMLSLNKTKSVEELAEFAGAHEALLSWKLDGLTVVLTYRQGELKKAVTRGNGEVGEVITNNAKVFKNIPLTIPEKGEVILRGEAVITYSDFEQINASIPEADAKYKNPRNLCSGSVRQLNNEITQKRNVNFFAFSLVKAEGVSFDNLRENQMTWMRSQGFDVVEFKKVTNQNMAETVAYFAEQIKTNDFPSDGLVLVLNDIAYGNSLGRTAKFPRDSIAFKWKDEIGKTRLLEIEWSASRTGLINPVAVFEPVELEGTTVSRASVHNVSIVKNLRLGIGDELEVYKANMIIPQIAQNLTQSGTIIIPKTCPVCNGPTEIKKMNDVEVLYCVNPECLAKKIKQFTLMVSRDALNIDGLSEATIEKFISEGFIHSFSDIFHLDNYREQIIEMEGFGEKSYQNLIDSITKARKTTLERVLYSLGIENVGLSNAKLLCKAFSYDLNKLRNASEEELSAINGIGPIMAKGIVNYFADEKKTEVMLSLLKELDIQIEQSEEALVFEGKTFVVTGSVESFANRSALKAWIESKGGKVTGTVTNKTQYLINNDTQSSSSKNKKAKELGIPIISEQDLLAMADTLGE